MLSRKRNDQIAMHCRRRAAGHKQAAVRPPCERRDGTLDLAGMTRIDRTQFHPEILEQTHSVPDHAAGEKINAPGTTEGNVIIGSGMPASAIAAAPIK